MMPAKTAGTSSLRDLQPYADSWEGLLGVRDQLETEIRVLLHELELLDARIVEKELTEP